MKITLKDLANNFGCTEYDFDEQFLKFYSTLDLDYRIIKGNEEKRLISYILKKIEDDTQKIGTLERTSVWDKGWKENLNEFRKTKEINSIVPKYIKPNTAVRLFEKFVEPSNPFFERDYSRLLQIYLHNNLIPKETENVYEFGCGSGFNLINLSNSRKNLHLFGTDFVNSSVTLINELSKHYNLKMKAELFDMTKPNYNYEIKEKSCTFTHGSIEQLAGKFQKFIDYLIQKKPEICFHLEPVIELYDERVLFDDLQIKFSRKRGYTEGLLTYLRKLENEGKIKIELIKKMNFGSLFIEGYNLIIWKSLI
jgi:hypothetical protein